MAAFTTEFTQAQLDALTRALGLGVLEVEHNGKRTKFQDAAEMRATRDLIKLELAAAANAAAATPAPMPCMTRGTVFWRN